MELLFIPILLLLAIWAVSTAYALKDVPHTYCDPRVLPHPWADEVERYKKTLSISEEEKS